MYIPVSQELKLYQLLCSWPPYEIQVKITAVIFKGVTSLVFLTNLFNQLKVTTKYLIGVSPRSLFFLIL